MDISGVALRNTCNTLQQSATKLIINTLTADKILSVTKSCQQFLRQRSVHGIFSKLLKNFGVRYWTFDIRY
jgi:hypothetical protein